MSKIFSLTTVFFLLAVFGGLVSRQFYIENLALKKEVAQLKSEPQVKAKEEAKDLARRLAALVVVPSGEDPVIATVTDKDKLKDQPIFANAENGDKLIIYAAAKKAYLFDEKNNKVKDIIPVNIGDQTGQVAGAQTATPSAEKKK